MHYFGVKTLSETLFSPPLMHPGDGARNTAQMTYVYWKNFLRAGDATKVQFCQCWVYSAVSTTFGRALGMATRSVTNFGSFHDSGYFFDKTYTKIVVENTVQNTAVSHTIGKSDSRTNYCSKECDAFLGFRRAFGSCPGSRADKIRNGEECPEDQAGHCRQCVPCLYVPSEMIWNFHVTESSYYSS